jgi:hypothetical protein
MAFAELDQLEARSALHVENSAQTEGREKVETASSGSAAAKPSLGGLIQASPNASSSQASVGSPATADRAELGTIELTAPLKDGINFYWRIPEHRNLKRSHFEQFKLFVDFVAASKACDELTAPPGLGE